MELCLMTAGRSAPRSVLSGHYRLRLDTGMPTCGNITLRLMRKFSLLKSAVLTQSQMHGSLASCYNCLACGIDVNGGHDQSNNGYHGDRSVDCVLSSSHNNTVIPLEITDKCISKTSNHIRKKHHLSNFYALKHLRGNKQISNTKATIPPHLSLHRLKQIAPAGSQSLRCRTFHTSSHPMASWCEDNPYGNPVDDLQSLVEVPILGENEHVFRPNEAELKLSQAFFKASRDNPIERQKGIVNLEDLPKHKLPEVCFIGRSNVGKSSLIKSLFFEPQDIRISVSRKPGHTRVLRFYNVKRKFALVDMPGYGYHMPEYFTESVENYIQTRQNLQLTFVLLDAQTGPTIGDIQFLMSLEQRQIRHCLVLTKIDKASRHKIVRNVLEVQQYMRDNGDSCFVQPFLVSAHQNAGIGLLRTFIAYVTGCIQINNM